MRELPEPDHTESSDEFLGDWPEGWSRNQVKAVQRQAYEDGLRDAMPLPAAPGASAPPAQQADNWRQYATEREDTAQAVIERHRKEHESLLRLLAKDRKTIADLQASVVQQEPAYYIVSVVVVKSTSTGFNTQNKLYPVAAVSPEEAHGKALNLAGADFPEHNLHTICSYRVQQAKPQPLSDEQIIASNYPDGEESGPTISAPDFELIAFARQIEAAHGIKE